MTEEIRKELLAEIAKMSQRLEWIEEDNARFKKLLDELHQATSDFRDAIENPYGEHIDREVRGIKADHDI